MRNLPFFLLISLFMTGCFSGSKATGLSGTSWEVVSIVDTDSTINITSVEHPTITFNSETEFGGQTPCNSIAGVYEVGDKGKLKMIAQSSTMALCPDIAYEAALIRAIESTKFFTIESDTLKLKDVEGRMIIKLSFAR